VTLLPVGLAGRDDADNFVLAFFSNVVGDEQQHDTPNQADGLSPQFASLDAVLLGNGIRVIEDVHGILEADAVLPFVAPRLCLVPLELNHAQYRIIMS